jgi:cytochrome oxidase Cu insertion factor (SCO1/SenC/PrrC family)
MNTGLNAGNPAVVAAFRTALLHQALLALVIFAVLAAGWLGLRLVRGSGAAAGPIPADPAGRKLLAVGFGNLWVLDGLLQAQPKMALGLPPLVIEPTASSSPHWVQDIVNWAGTAWSYHPTQAGAAAVWIQVGIGIWMLAAPRGPVSRLAGLAAASWGLVVWVFGESFGGIFAPGQSWLFGTPGAALVYVAAGILLALSDRAWRSPRTGRVILSGLGVFLIGMAALQAWPGNGFWQGVSHGEAGILAGMTQSMALTPQPGFLSGSLSWFGGFAQAHGFALNLVVVGALALIGGAFASGRSRLVRPALAVFAVLCLADWVLVQDLGFLGGVGTDPNSMIPFLLLALAGYLALIRVPDTEPEAPAKTAGERANGLVAAARAGDGSRWLAHPVQLGQQVGRGGASAVAAAASTGAWVIAAAGGAALILVGAVPLAVAQASPNADPILAQSITGRTSAEDVPSPGFALTDQFGRTVTLAGLRGKVVLLSFISPGCVAECPPVWQEFAGAARLAGAGPSRLELVGIALGRGSASVAALRAFDRRQDLDGVRDWLYLTGSAAQLQRLRQAFGISATEVTTPAMTERAQAYVIDGAGDILARYITGPGPGTAAISSSFTVLFANAARQALRSG